MRKNVTTTPQLTEYQSPECHFIDIDVEGVLCGSIFGNEEYDDPVEYPNTGWN